MSSQPFDVDWPIHNLRRVLYKSNPASVASINNIQSLRLLVSVILNPNEALVCHEQAMPLTFGCHFECLCCTSAKDPTKKFVCRSARSALVHVNTMMHKGNVQMLNPAILAPMRDALHQCEYHHLSSFSNDCGFECSFVYKLGEKIVLSSCTMDSL
jgi:hypothetical protein